MTELTVAPEEIINDLQELVREMELFLMDVVRETESHTFGKPDYDITMDDLHDKAQGMLGHLYREKAWGYYV